MLTLSAVIAVDVVCQCGCRKLAVDFQSSSLFHSTCRLQRSAARCQLISIKIPTERVYKAPPLKSKSIVAPEGTQDAEAAEQDRLKIYVYIFYTSHTHTHVCLLQLETFFFFYGATHTKSQHWRCSLSNRSSPKDVSGC